MGRRGAALAGFAVLACFVGVEGRLRQGEAARSLDAGADDDGTTAAVGAAFGAALVGGPLLALWRRGRLPSPVGWVGVALMAGGLALRVGSARTLGAHYTRTLRTADDQPVIAGGPYRWIRHPGYAGMIVLWSGFGLALTSMPAVVATTVPNLVAYRLRIRAEEAMLVDALGDAYRDYQEQTARLVPHVY